MNRRCANPGAGLGELLAESCDAGRNTEILAGQVGPQMNTQHFAHVQQRSVYSL